MWKTEVHVRNHLQLLFNLIHWIGISQSSQELTDMAHLISQLTLGTLCLSPWRLELLMDHHTHLASLWFLGIKILVLTLAWQALNH